MVTATFETTGRARVAPRATQQSRFRCARANAPARSVLISARACVARAAIPREERRSVSASRGAAPYRLVARASSADASMNGSMAKACDVDELPRGERKLVRMLGKSILLFWYRDTVFAIESRSPAEGAYSEGFERARLTQDACIECPTTKSKFDLKTGEIKEWYPDNPVLRQLTPQDTCRPMEVFPVEMRADGIYVDAKNGSLGPDFVAPIGLGGSNTSLENNNVFAVETPMYVEGEERGVRISGSGEDSTKLDASQLGGAIAIGGVIAVAGTGACLYYENYIALGALWLVGFAAAAAVALKTTGALDD